MISARIGPVGKSLIKSDANAIDRLAPLLDQSSLIRNFVPILLRMNGLLPKQGLYDPQFEHDACGIGFLLFSNP